MGGDGANWATQGGADGTQTWLSDSNINGLKVSQIPHLEREEIKGDGYFLCCVCSL